MSRNTKSYSWAASVALFSLTCACDSKDGSIDGTSEELTSTASSLEDTADSLDSAREEAGACFEAFRACAGAEDADLEACRLTLSECLPDEAPLPPRCEIGEGEGEDTGVRPPPGHRPPPTDEGDGECDPEDGEVGVREPPEGDDDVRPMPPEEGDEAAEDEGVREEADVEIVIREGRRDHGDEGVRCERPPVPGEDLHGCREVVEGTLAGGGSEEAARAAHAECVAGAFEGHLISLCERGAELCSADEAPAELCTRVSEVCASVDA
jgi:hypothetical protein